MPTLIDAALADRLLRNALAGTPALSEAQFTDLMALAGSLDELGDVVYSGTGLNRAAALGWSWKAALVADQYDLGGGQGRTLDRSQWFAHCERMQMAYRTGAASVIGADPDTGRSSGTIRMVSSLAADEGVW